MERMQKVAILAELVDRLRIHGSWGGETHVQKAAYFLQDVLGVPLGVEYILYKHGPYSFDLTEQLTGMRADYLLENEYVTEGYGPRLVPTKESAELRKNYPKTLGSYLGQIDFVATRFGSKGVADLEKLATALWVTREKRDDASREARAARLHELKPHIRLLDALEAVDAFDAFVLHSKESIVMTPSAA